MFAAYMTEWITIYSELRVSRMQKEPPCKREIKGPITWENNSQKNTSSKLTNYRGLNYTNGHLMRRVDSLEKTLNLGGIGAGGEGDNRGWDGWMASLTQWAWVWVDSGSWWWTGRPGVLRSIWSPRVRHDWATELNWMHIQTGELVFGLLVKGKHNPASWRRMPHPSVLI